MNEEVLNFNTTYCHFVLMSFCKVFNYNDLLCDELIDMCIMHFVQSLCQSFIHQQFIS